MKFFVGDRVKVTGFARLHEGTHMGVGPTPPIKIMTMSRSFDGVRVTVVDEYFATVVFRYDGCLWETYKTACRKLKPKAKPREFWLVGMRGFVPYNAYPVKQANVPKGEEQFLVREVRDLSGTVPQKESDNAL